MDTCVGWSVCNRMCNCLVLLCLVLSCLVTSLHYTTLTRTNVSMRSLLLTATFKSMEAPASSGNLILCRWLYLGDQTSMGSPCNWYSHLHSLIFLLEVGASIDLKVMVSTRMLFHGHMWMECAIACVIVLSCLVLSGHFTSLHYTTLTRTNVSMRSLLLTTALKSAPAPTSTRNINVWRWLYLLNGLPIQLIQSPTYTQISNRGRCWCRLEGCSK